eukprot:333432-Prorocentrum_minimum.AAC.2
MQPTRFAFVEFDAPQAAAVACGLTGTYVGGYAIQVSQAKSPIQSANSLVIPPGGLGALTPASPGSDALSKVRAPVSYYFVCSYGSSCAVNGEDAHGEDARVCVWLSLYGAGTRDQQCCRSFWEPAERARQSASDRRISRESGETDT